jgi:hypothetical protein
VHTELNASTLLSLLVLLCFDHLPQLSLILLCSLQSNLPRDERELRHFLAGFLPDWGFVKLRQLLQLFLGELLGIGDDRILLNAFPIEIFVQKPLHDIPLRSELRILLELAFKDLLCQPRQALIDLHDDEEVLSSLTMTFFISHRHGMGEQHGNRHQATVKHRSHHTVLFLPYGKRFHSEAGPLIPHPPYGVQPEGMTQTDTKKVEIFEWFLRGICGIGAATMRTTPRGREGWRWWPWQAPAPALSPC